MTTTMTAIEISEFGPPRVLKAVQRPMPQIAPADVLIRVIAAGVNRPDVLQRKGYYPPPPGASDIPGLELSGEIVSIGAAVSTQVVGAQVCALVSGGGYAQYAAVPAVQCLPIPHGVSVEDAAAIPETFFTVYLNVFQRARLQNGETLLVHGGSSGIGTTAIMLGKAFGARVIVTAGSDDKCRACLNLGADHAINYRSADFVPAVMAATGNQGADVILDMVGGEYIGRDIAAAAPDGRIAVIATQGGAKSELDLRAMMMKRVHITGSTLRPQSVAAKGKLAAELRERVWPLFTTARLSPLVCARFALEEAWRAHELMESNAHIGKILLTT